MLESNIRSMLYSFGVFMIIYRFLALAVSFVHHCITNVSFVISAHLLYRGIGI